MIWKPNVTVAAVIERDGKFLLVEEETDDGIRFNQPAGHLECGESLLDAVVRETREETRYDFVPQALVGIYNWRHPVKDLTYLRFAFAGEITGCDPERELDEGIIAARWLSLDEIRASSERHRSPLILRCVEDWLAGRRYPLDLLVHYAQA
ncbi:NUDIX hydrolase [Rhodocyclus purpureus]|uniref:NUDIX hydrolase n=1 Tax=Rhodocyclus purpureus TaxID=1067 RepID=UPI0019129558|nr:NUDIX hydrolase [Rhodocyclus purpureus]MBK5914443.1 NUDIX hydrolase [Rhodocyclus purpureus]